MLCQPSAMASVFQTLAISEVPSSWTPCLSPFYFHQRTYQLKARGLHFSSLSNSLVVCSSVHQLLFSVATATEETQQDSISSAQDGNDGSLDTTTNSSPSYSTEFPWFPARYARIKELFLQICDGSDVPSAMDPWFQKLTVHEWNELLLRCGLKDINLAKQILAFFRQKEPALDQAVLFPKKADRPPPSSNTRLTSALSGECDEDSSQDTAEKSMETPGKATLQKEQDQDDLEIDSFRNDVEQSSEFISASLKLYTTFANVLRQHRMYDEIDTLEAEVKEVGLVPNVHYYNVLLQSYTERRLIPKAIELLHYMKSSGFEPHIYVYEKLAFVCMNKAEIDVKTLHEFVEDLRSRNSNVLESLYRKLLRVHWLTNNVTGAEEVFKALMEAGHPPEQKDILKLMQLHGRKGQHKRVVELLDLMSEAGGKPTPSAYNFLIHAYCKAGLMENAKEILSKFDSVFGMKPTSIAINMLIDGYGKQGLHKEALNMFEAIREYGYRPTWVSYSSIISAMAKVGKVHSAAELYEKMLRTGVQPNLHTYSTLIRLYTKCNQTREGRKVYQTMRRSPSKMTSTEYSVSLALYVDGTWYHEAADLLKEMEEKGVALDALAHNSLIRSFSYLESKTTPLARAVLESELKICKVLASLFHAVSDNQEVESSIIEAVFSILEEWKESASLESKGLIYNAFTDYFWKKGYKNIAKNILDLGKELYAGYSRPHLLETAWVLDVRGLGIGAAMVALRELLFTEKWPLEEKGGDGTMIVLITGDDFSLSLPQDNTKVKFAVSSLLKELDSPFVISQNGSDRFEASLADVLKWASKVKLNANSSLY